MLGLMQPWVAAVEPEQVIVTDEQMILVYVSHEEMCACNAWGDVVDLAHLRDSEAAEQFVFSVEMATR